MFLKYLISELWIDLKVFSLFFFAAMIAPIHFTAPKWCCVRRPDHCLIWNCKYHWDDNNRYCKCTYHDFYK